VHWLFKKLNGVFKSIVLNITISYLFLGEKMAVSARKVGLYGTVGFLVAALIIVGVVISSVEIPSLRPPAFIPDTGTLIIKVTDAPVDLEQLNITIDSVSAHKVEGDSWINLTFVGGESEVSFNLLELQDKAMDLCITDVSPGNYTMIKIHIDKAEAVYASEDVGGTDEIVKPGKPAKTAKSKDLNVPSDAIRVIVHFEVQNEGETTVLVDIEPDWVAISESNNLRPVLKATVISGEGSG